MHKDPAAQKAEMGGSHDGAQNHPSNTARQTLPQKQTSPLTKQTKQKTPEETDYFFKNHNNNFISQKESLDSCRKQDQRGFL